jgi:hypothetical protein
MFYWGAECWFQIPCQTAGLSSYEIKRKVWKNLPMDIIP